MIAYAATLAWGRARLTGMRRAKLLALALAAGPWCGAAAIRWLVWGRPAPLAVLAKPSDLSHGLAYVLGAVALAGPTVAVFAPFAWRKLAPWPRTLVVGAFVHLVVVAFAGGDWMPLARLICPVLPSLVLVVAHLICTPGARFAAALRLALGCFGEIAVFVTRGPAASRVLSDRMVLIESVGQALAGAERVATIDVGWVGAATDAEIVDLAGATDPEIAALPGGHTSKAISGAFLTGRHPDRLIFQVFSPSGGAEGPVYARATEERLARDPLIARAYTTIWRSSGELPITYVVLSPVTP
jgi:hypothetical protein